MMKMIIWICDDLKLDLTGLTYRLEMGYSRKRRHKDAANWGLGLSKSLSRVKKL